MLLHPPVPGADVAGAMSRLVTVVQELSLARCLDAVTRIVRTAARELLGADGASFVLRDNGSCFYADEDAIAPLWKGQRFPMSACISGWAMLHKSAVAVEDIYADARIPHDAYRPTFVKSLVMVPIRSASPIGAIGTYWASLHRAADEEVRLLQALADSTSIALENVELYADLERRVRERTAELSQANDALAERNAALLELQRQREQLSALLVHDLRSPASGIMLSAKVSLRRPALPNDEAAHWGAVLAAAESINRMATNLLDITRSEDGALEPQLRGVDAAALLADVVALMQPLASASGVRLDAGAVSRECELVADPDLLRRVLQNLVDNAVRYSPAGGTVRLEVRSAGGDVLFVVADDGPGIPDDQKERVFEKWVSLDGPARKASSAPPAGLCVEGKGLGLAFCRLAAGAHGGSICVADARKTAPRGCSFTLRLPARGPGPRAAHASRPRSASS